MEVLLIAAVLQLVAVLGLIVLASNDPGIPLRLRARRDGRTEPAPDDGALTLRRRAAFVLLGLLAGATALAALGVGRVY
ncbi:hypothetical protein ER308_16370 [Egibacter rhizosphaerae]|uniref:Uncharacterized protein n=1 Tax=Egibacter rhizosphaerae TaxID=1670831 RepID=A0A411YI80_9ACTN|nr:hypothetical protein [Egibacter rhizosphaerae]QBI20994.1 hypothetical protein ER308_16370 [Egibacter rhizosphaerae]